MKTPARQVPGGRFVFASVAVAKRDAASSKNAVIPAKARCCPEYLGAIGLKAWQALGKLAKRETANSKTPSFPRRLESSAAVALG